MAQILTLAVILVIVYLGYRALLVLLLWRDLEITSQHIRHLEVNLKLQELSYVISAKSQLQEAQQAFLQGKHATCDDHLHVVHRQVALAYEHWHNFKHH